MKKQLWLICAGIWLAGYGALAGPIPGGLVQDVETYPKVAAEVTIWASDPVSTTLCIRATEPNACCILRSDCTDFGSPYAECTGMGQGPFADNVGQCVSLAQSAVNSVEVWTRNVYACLRKDADFACELGFEGSKRTMHCTVLPGDNVILDTVSKCLSGQAAISFP